jgi:hypothetical protein
LQILLQEMKKIFHPVMLLILVLINVLMYYVFIEFHISYFPNGRPATDDYRIGIEMVEKYGHELDQQEFADFKVVYQQEIKKADELIQANQVLSEMGITSFKEFQELGPGANSAFDDVRDKLIFEDKIDLFWELPQREKIIEDMEHVEERFGYSYIGAKPTKKQELRIKEVVNSGTFNSIFPAYPVEDNFLAITKYITITILLSVLFMISPIFIRDYKNNMVCLQYTSKTGRSLFKWKIGAGLLSAFLITTVQIGVYYSIYSTNDIGMFLNSGVNSFMGRLYWYDITFLQLINITIGLTYLVTLSMALLSIFVSSIAKNYISVIGIQLPIFVIICFLVMDGYLMGEAFSIYQSQFLVASLNILIVFLPLVLIILKWRRERKQDILH